MSGIVLFIAAHQSKDVQRRAIRAVNVQRARLREHVAQIRRNGFTPEVERRDLPPTLDAWYREQPTLTGRIKPKLSLSAEAKRCYGIPETARLVDLRGVGAEVDHWSVGLFPVVGGYVVGLKAPAGNGGIGVFWRQSRKATDYAMRLSVEHDAPIRERWA